MKKKLTIFVDFKKKLNKIKNTYFSQIETVLKEIKILRGGGGDNKKSIST